MCAKVFVSYYPISNELDPWKGSTHFCFFVQFGFFNIALSNIRFANIKSMPHKPQPYIRNYVAQNKPTTLTGLNTSYIHTSPRQMTSRTVVRVGVGAHQVWELRDFPRVRLTK